MRVLYLALIDRGLAAQAEKFGPELAQARATRSAPSRFALFHAYAAAYRASTLPTDDPQRTALINRASDGLAAFTAAIASDRTRMADQLLFCQNTVVRLYEQLVALDALPLIERPAARAAIAAGADAALELKKERGAFNRAFHLAHGLADTARLLPDHPSAQAWRTFADHVWADFTGPGDTFEDSTGYNGLWACSVFHLAAITHQEAFLLTPRSQAIFDRFLAWMAPNGAYPDLGNASYFLHGAPQWLDALERLGALAARSDAQEAAERLARLLLSQPTFTSYELEPLVEALSVASTAPATAPRPARPSAEITYRKTDYGDTVPDKLILRAPTPLGPGFVCVDLHDGGYHGHADGGALVLFTLGEGVALHELGRPAVAASLHQTALVTHPDDGFPLPTVPANTWTTWIINHRWPGTYVGQLTPDLGRVDKLFFRLQSSNPQPSVAPTVEIGEVLGELPDGSLHQFAPGWKGSLGPGRESGFIYAPAAGELDLSPYVRLAVRWRSPRPAAVQFFGLDAAARNGDAPSDTATLRTWAAQPVVSAVATPDALAPSSVVERLLRDTRGRLVQHRRTLTLHATDGRLVVTDRFLFDETGDYEVGPVWHADRLLPALAPASGVLVEERQSPSLALATRALNVTFSGPPDIRISHSSKSSPSTLAASARVAVRAGDTVEITSILTPTSP
jgi:hypothetical protein